MMLVVPLTQHLIDEFGWRAAFRVLAVLCVAWIVPSSLWLMRRRLEDRRQTAKPENRGQTPTKKMREPGSDPHLTSNLTLKGALRTQAFWLLMAAYFFGNVCSQTLHVHQVAYLVDHGLAAIVAAAVVGVVGFASIVGKTGGGWLSDRIDREIVYVAGIAILVSSSFVLLSLGRPPAAWGAYAYAVMLGLGYSVTAAITPAMMADRFSGPHFGSIVGIGLMGTAAGSALGPWGAGRLYDATGSYTTAFLIAAAAGVVAGTAGWRARALRRAKPHPGNP
jgi:MFS family permease